MKNNENNEKNKENSLILSKIKEIYGMMCVSNIEEVKINIEDFDLRVKRFSKKRKESLIPSNEINLVSSIFEKEQKSFQQKEELKGEEIVSPINGVFYRSPSPGAPPFVNEGDIVAAGSVLCIVEAMKVMNEIKAEKKCKILKILCQNGSSVTTGTKLFIIESI